MCCTNISRCNNYNLIQVDNYHLSLSCNSIFKKNKKILIKRCKNQIINFHTNIPYCISCHSFIYS